MAKGWRSGAVGRWAAALVAILAVVAAAPAAAWAATLDADAAGAVWIADARGLLKLDAVRADLVLEVSGAPGTRALAVDRGAGVLWAYGGGELRAFDLGGRALFEVPVVLAGGGGAAAGAGSARPVAVAGGGAVWVAEGTRLLAFDATGQALRSLSLGAPVRGLALDVERGLLWVATAARVVAYGSGDGYERLELALGERPQVVGIACDAVAGSVWVAHADRLQRHGADGTRQLEVAGDAGQPLRAVAAAGATGVWIAGGRWLAHVDAAGRVGAPVGPFAARGTIGEMAVDPRSGDVWVAGESELARVSAAGAVVRQLTFEPPLSILDLALDPGPAVGGGGGGSGEGLEPGDRGSRMAGASGGGAESRDRPGAGAVEREDGAGATRAQPRGLAGMKVPTEGSAAGGQGVLARTGRGGAADRAGDAARRPAAPRDTPGPNATVVTGTVYLPDGAVLAGVTVNVLGQPAVSATTAADGTFSLSNVAAAAGLTLGDLAVDDRQARAGRRRGHQLHLRRAAHHGHHGDRSGARRGQAHL